MAMSMTDEEAEALDKEFTNGSLTPAGCGYAAGAPLHATLACSIRCQFADKILPRTGSCRRA